MSSLAKRYARAAIDAARANLLATGRCVERLQEPTGRIRRDPVIIRCSIAPTKWAIWPNY